MSTILDQIIATKHDEVAAIKSQESELLVQAKDTAPAVSFFEALSNCEKPFLIAEVKKASPSKGIIREDFHPVELARAYEKGGANALSVLTDEQYFQGHLNYLKEISSIVNLPTLRKDFIIDPIQIYEAKIVGASAILLIAAALSAAQLALLAKTATDLGLDYLLEVHAPEELEVIKQSGIEPKIMGINNRNLKDFKVDLEVTKQMISMLPESVEVIVSESGIYTPDDIKQVMTWGAGGVLVGESLMRQDDVTDATRSLLKVT